MEILKKLFMLDESDDLLKEDIFYIIVELVEKQ